MLSDLNVNFKIIKFIIKIILKIVFLVVQRNSNEKYMRKKHIATLKSFVKLIFQDYQAADVIAA